MWLQKHKFRPCIILTFKRLHLCLPRCNVFFLMRVVFRLQKSVVEVVIGCLCIKDDALYSSFFSLAHSRGKHCTGRLLPKNWIQRLYNSTIWNSPPQSSENPLGVFSLYYRTRHLTSLRTCIVYLHFLLQKLSLLSCWHISALWLCWYYQRSSYNRADDSLLQTVNGKSARRPFLYCCIFLNDIC